MNQLNRFFEFLWDLATWGAPVLLLAVFGLIRKVFTNEKVLKEEREAREQQISLIKGALKERDERDKRERQEQRERLTRIETRQDETYKIIIENLASRQQ